MKNKITVYMMIAALSLSALSGCGKSAGDAADPQATDTAKEAPEAEGVADSADTDAVEDKATAGTEAETESAEAAADSGSNADETADKPDPELMVMKKYYYETADDENYTNLLTGHVVTPVLSDESALVYPELAKSMEAEAKKELDYFESEVTRYTAEAQDFYNETYPDYFYGGYTLTQDVNVKRADGQVVSVFFPVTSYMGGAHGMYGNGATTYDSRTGKVLELKDVLSRTDDLRQILKKALEKEYPDHEDIFFGLEDSLSHYVPYAVSIDESTGETAEDYENYEVGYTWALNKEGLEFYFGPYELAAYASGAQSVVLSYDEYSDLIKPEYIPTETKAGFIEFFDKYMYAYDLDGDGETDSVSVDPVWNEAKEDEYDQDYINLDIYFNSESLRLSEDYDIPDPDQAKGYYIHTDDGRDYVYVIAPTYSDYIELIVVDITGGKLKKVGEEYYPSFVAGYDTDTDISREYVLSDPNKMKFASRFDLITTFSAFKNYHVGSDGMPVSDDKVYEISYTGGWEPVTCIKDFEATYINESGEEEPFTVKKGETFEFIETDGETYLDTVISDGTKVRLYIEGNGMEMKVNGLDASEVFKELMYAG